MKQIILMFFVVFILYSCNNKKTKECDIETINKLAFENLSSFRHFIIATRVRRELMKKVSQRAVSCRRTFVT